jgi:hypothetical protein
MYRSATAHQFDYFAQGGHALPLADVNGLDLLQRQTANRSGIVCQTRKVLVVDDDHVAVAAEAHVQFKQSGAHFDCALERTQGIFRLIGRSSPMRDVVHH